jgi:hypothetical protein
MAWTLTTTITLGPAYAGLSDLRAQLFDTAGANVGAAITTGFSADLATGRGQYVWSYASMPDGHRGGVRFFSNAAAAASSVSRSVTAEDEITAKAGAAGVDLSLLLTTAHYDTTQGNLTEVLAANQTELLTAIGGIGGAAVNDTETIVESNETINES